MAYDKGEKNITVGKLKMLFSELQDADVLCPNEFLNLSIIRNGEYIGYIDISDEVVEVGV